MNNEELDISSEELNEILDRVKIIPEKDAKDFLSMYISKNNKT